MRSDLLFMSNDSIYKELQDVDFYKSLTAEEIQYIKDRFDCKVMPKICPVDLERVLKWYKEQTDEQLIEFFKFYEIGEYVSYEEEMDYLMSRIGHWLGQRPKIVDYFNSSYLVDVMHIQQEVSDEL
jgi:hypothetical protein